MTRRVFFVVLYDRDRGPICYEVPLWKWNCYLPAHLLSCGLTWYWRSLRTAPVSEESPVQGLPEGRPWTRLGQDNQHVLIDDFHEWNVDGDLRDVFILGLDAGAVTTSLTEDAIQDAANAFLEERGPLQVVIVSHHDDPSQFVFLRHEEGRTSATTRLLETWHLTTLPPDKKHRYSRLRVAQLEHILPFL